MGKQKKSQVSKSKGPKDFVKKKKKVGKKLQATNETAISIKTRKIVLPTQHSKKEDHELIFKGKSVTDLLIGSKHTNCNQRVSNLVNLHDLLSSNRNQIEPHTGALLERLGVLLQDPEENVRSSAVVLGKFILSQIKSSDLVPFLQVFVVQLSSGMLHINKDIQLTAVHILLLLLQNHFLPSMKFSESLITSLVTVLSTCKNKKNLLLYFQVISHILKYQRKSDTAGKKENLKQSAIDLYKYSTRSELSLKKSMVVSEELIKQLFECSLCHIETIWLEETPSQVYVFAEPVALRTSTAVIDLLMLFYKTNASLSRSAMMKLNSINKSITGRYPLVCNIPTRDSSMLWQLNLKIAEYLVVTGRHEKVESHYLSLYSSRIQTMTGEEVSQSLSIIALIPLPQPSTKMKIHEMCCPGLPHAALFLSHFIQYYLPHWTGDMAQIMKNVADNIQSVAHQILECFHGNQLSFSPDIFKLCAAKDVFSSLNDDDQILLLELYIHLPDVSPTEFAALGQVVRTASVQHKFHGVLQSLYHQDRVSVSDYISILLTQANRDDDESAVDFKLVQQFTEILMDGFRILPAQVRGSLFHLTLSPIVDRLYSGLSDFSLTAYLLLLSGLGRLSGESLSTVTAAPSTITKLCKIVCSLIFNKDSLSDWGRDIVLLATKLSFEQINIFMWICNNLESKPVDVLYWYLKLCLTLPITDNKKKRSGVLKIYNFLAGKVSEQQNLELKYRLSIHYDD